jgi:hypothetical protein
VLTVATLLSAAGIAGLAVAGTPATLALGTLLIAAGGRRACRRDTQVTKAL